MEKQIKPQNLFIGRNRLLTAIATLVLFAFGAVLAVVLPLGMIKHPPADSSTAILVCVGASVLAVYSLALAALNLRNLFFPYILTTDEKGIYNYSGLFHYGFISWENIAAVSRETGLLDFLDNEMPSIKISIKNLKDYKLTVPFGKKWLLFWSGSNVKIFTICSQIKKRELCGMLEEALKYYNRPDVAAETTGLPL